MSFVGGSFAHDIFVSYSHGQNLSVPYSDPRRNPLYEWSCIFVDNLRSQLELILSDSVLRPDERPDVWMDPKLNSTGSLQGNLEREVKGSALLLTLMSSYYLRSPWCSEEARLFSEAAGAFSPVSREDRTFVVSIAPTDRKKWPTALQDDRQRAFLGSDFYRMSSPEEWTPFGFPAPNPSSDDEYWTGIRRLASEIASQLRRMKHSQENKVSNADGATVPVFVGRKLLLGYCSDTLMRKRSEVRKALSSLEMQVLPEEDADITDPQSLNTSFERYLPQADAVIVLANEFCGTWPKGEPGGFVSHQVRMAKEQRKRCFVWKSIQKPAEIQTQAYAKYLDGLPAELAETRGAVCDTATGAAEFSAFVKQQLANMSPKEIVRRAIVCSNLLTRSDEYKQFHERVLKAVGETDRISILPGSVSPSGQIHLSSLAEKIKQSDTIIVLCFDQEWDWAFDVLVQLRQVSSPEEPEKTRLLIVGPHYQPEKGDVDVSNFRFQTFKQLEVDENTFKKQLKRKIDRAIISPAQACIDSVALTAAVTSAAQQTVQGVLQ
jgi:hypothetical protein